MKDGCKFCDKKGLLILPLRYAAVAGEAGKSLPALPATLGSQVSDLALNHAKYAPRMLRQGYLYVLIKRPPALYWEAYRIIGDAFLYKFDIDQPPQIIPTFSCDRSVCGVDASMFAIDKVDAVEKIYVLFTPSPMTKAKLKEYKDEAEAKVAKGKMQVFDPKAWVGGANTQQHSLKPDQLPAHVPEFMLYKQCAKAPDSVLGKGMLTHLFVPMTAAYAGTPVLSPEEGSPGRLGQLELKMKKTKAAAFVLHDHIGITQEMNDYRNAPLEGIEHYMAATDEFGASNLERLQVSEAIEEVRAGFEQGLVGSTQAYLDRHKKLYDPMSENDRNLAKTLRARGRHAEAQAIEDRLARIEKGQAENFKRIIAETKEEGRKKWLSDYASRLDVAEMTLFKKTLEARSAAAFAEADKRAPDHLKWFESDRLVNAFDTFDPHSQVSGYEFAIESAICSFGLSTCELGAERIDAWAQANSVERKNLYMRGYYHNQKDLLDAAKKVYADINAAAGSVKEASSMTVVGGAVKVAKGVVDGFKKVDSAFDEWARNQGQDFSEKWAKPAALAQVKGNRYGPELILFHKLSEITRTVFRKGLGGKGDVMLIARLSGVLYARLGKVTEQLMYEDLMLKVDPAELADGHEGRTAQQNKEAVERRNRGSAAAQAKADLAPALEDLVADAREKAKNKIKLEDIVDNPKPATNNYHQTRIGVVLGCIELIGLGEKLVRAKMDRKSMLELTAAAASVGSIVLDTYYSAAKSIREIKKYNDIRAIKNGADIVRGGFKIGAGVLGSAAGTIGSILDLEKLETEKDPVLRQIFGFRAATGFVSAGLTILAAFSYTESLLIYLARGFVQHSVRYELLISLSWYAAVFSARVRLLVWMARLNWVGLAFTLGEIGYLWIKDDDLQNWCEKSVFRKDKKYKTWLGKERSSDYYTYRVTELTELEKGAQTIGVGVKKDEKEAGKPPRPPASDQIPRGTPP